MSACFYIEVVAILTHFVYGIVRWAYEGGGNINEEIALPVLVFLYWLVAILYLTALILAVIVGKVKTVVAVIVFTIIGVGLVNLIILFGLVAMIVVVIAFLIALYNNLLYILFV